MSAWSLPNPLVIVPVLLTALPGVPWFAVHGLQIAVRSGGSLRQVMRGAAFLTGSAAYAVYAFGVLTMFQDESAADQACKEAVGPRYAGDVAGYETSFLPLRFGCRVDGVGTWDVWVPGWVNPVLLGLVVLTAVLALAARALRPPPATGAMAPPRRFRRRAKSPLQ